MSLQHLQQEETKKWKNIVFPSKEAEDSIQHMDINYKKFFIEISSSLQKAYELGKEEAMESVKGEMIEKLNHIYM